MKNVVFTIVAISILSGCETFITPRYSIEADNFMALRQLQVGDVSVGNFSGTDVSSDSCQIAPPDGYQWMSIV